MPIGNQGTAIAAVDHKEVDVMVSSDPAQTLLEKQGKIKVLIDGRTTAGSKEELGRAIIRPPASMPRKGSSRRTR